MELSAQALLGACADDGLEAGILIVTELEPLAGPGAPTKPAVYEGGRYQLDRRWDGEGEAREPVDVVVIDNVPSQANRLELALSNMREDLGLPEIVLDLSSLEPLPAHLPRRLSSFEFPHRHADAYLRDAVLDGTPFERTAVGEMVLNATKERALPLLEWFPQSLLYGFWQSHLGSKRTQAKLARSWVSEIVGIRPATTDTCVLGVKGDPLNLSVDQKVVFDPEMTRSDWQLTDSKKETARGKGERLSEIGHGQVPFKQGEEARAGISFEAIRQQSSLSFAGLRQVRVDGAEHNAAARAVVASLGLAAHVAAFGAAFHLRSGCDLRLLRTRWTWLGSDRDESLMPLTLDAARQLVADCVKHAESLEPPLPVGSNWPQPLVVAPTEQLAAVVRRSWPVAD